MGADGLDQQVAQRPAVELELAEHVENLAAEGMARLLELLQQAMEYVALPGLLGHQVPQMAHLGLADAVDSAETLLKTIRIPGQIVVHHQMSALKVDALSRRIGREQRLHVGIVQERFLRSAPL